MLRAKGYRTTACKVGILPASRAHVRQAPSRKLRCGLLTHPDLVQGVLVHGVTVGDSLVLQHAAQPPGGLRLVPGILQAGARLHLQAVVGLKV
jgi:hypothetical protein